MLKKKNVQISNTHKPSKTPKYSPPSIPSNLPPNSKICKSPPLQLTPPNNFSKLKQRFKKQNNAAIFNPIQAHLANKKTHKSTTIYEYNSQQNQKFSKIRL